ncbi:short-chain dehydrogenase [Geomonas silvestris]|uniref:Short-chain dehydrogenase n=1 Tax=Geomonas silvestris TaxID=2740184 RepID=A0A6V8MFQ9_9BACT|nr:SDR family oxidoreductase [Geomonas silvestris]GFO58825.1 short-chain dehydrogenase [Geomonas silvestris]
MKIALITGGSRGLGRNIALHLAQKGIDVILTYHSREAEAQNAVRQIGELGRKAVALQLDVAKHKSYPEFAGQVKKVLVESWQRDDFDYLVNNAGFGVWAPFMETTEEQFDQLVDVHLKAAFFLSQKLLPIMKNGGSIVNISSGLARFSLPGYSAYGSLKAAMDALSRYLAVELGGRQIRVNSLAPGAIETDFGGGVVRDNPEVNAGIAAQTALGRVGLPDDIGGAVAALLSEDSRWINGQRIEASGGIHL